MSGRRYREKWDFRDCNMYERTNSSMDQVLMTGTTKRRRRYRAIDKPLRASTAKMNHAVICEPHNIKPPIYVLAILLPW